MSPNDLNYRPIVLDANAVASTAAALAGQQQQQNGAADDGSVDAGSESPRRPPSPRTADASGLRVTKIDGDSVCRRIHDGARHAVGGLPAVVRANGDLEWFCDDAVHRDDRDKPAVRRTSGVSEWRRHGKLHREGDLPAVVFHDLRPHIVATARRPHREWWVDGRRHRAGGLPAVERADGGDEFWENGLRHRAGGLPAVIMHTGRQEWWEFGLLHRNGDLPAVVHGDGTAEWFWRGLRHREGGLPAYVGRSSEWQLAQISWPAVEDGVEGGAEGGVEGAEYGIEEVVAAEAAVATSKANCGYRVRRRHYTVIEERWYFHGALHRGHHKFATIRDGQVHDPAIVRYDPAGSGKWMSREWYWLGQRHRHDLDMPAVENASGFKAWYWFDKLHRQHGDWTQPTLVHSDGWREYYRHDRKQRWPHLAVPVVEAFRAARAWLPAVPSHGWRRCCCRNARSDVDDDAQLSAAERGCLLGCGGGGGKED